MNRIIWIWMIYLGYSHKEVGLSSNIARMALPLVSKFLLRNAEPQRASGFMSMLPSSITNMFSGDERERFTTTQENVSEDEVIDQISRECCNGDREKGRIAYQEAVKVLREKTLKTTTTTTRTSTRRRRRIS